MQNIVTTIGFPMEKASRILLCAQGVSALEIFVLPYVWQAAKEGKTGIHVAIVSHGLCIGELVSELLNWDGKKGRSTGSEYSDIPNAGWNRVVIDIEVSG